MSIFAAEWLLRERLDWSKTDLIKHYNKNIPWEEILQFEEDVNQFARGLPMQQIIGHDWFYDRKFIITEDTLIPRPETEEWIDRLLKKLPNRSLKVLDIGTGTGVLAITQKLERPQDQILAIDISRKALNIAERNANNLNAEIKFIQSDLFQELDEQTFDLILSNPPYISWDERNLMDESVLTYEPREALFAENDGLAIYEKIATNISKYVKKGSYIALEVGYKQAETVSNLFKQSLPNGKIEIWTDFNNLNRLVFITV